MDQQKIFFAILGMMVVTYLPRLLPAWLLANRELPVVLKRWLRFVPVAVLSTLLWPSLLLEGSDHHFAVRADNLQLIVALPTAALALISRSFLGTVVVGVALIAIARQYVGA